MLEINIRFPEKEDAEKLNADICSFFQGSKAFTNNDIIVGPVYDGWFKNKKTISSISLSPTNLLSVESLSKPEKSRSWGLRSCGLWPKKIVKKTNNERHKTW